MRISVQDLRVVPLHLVKSAASVSSEQEQHVLSWVPSITLQVNRSVLGGHLLTSGVCVQACRATPPPLSFQGALHMINAHEPI